ncbi:MAG: hypothetical protein SOX70_01225 [Peptoniphilaceae bacterium]|nr:hypothetical protein [Peptoniphilaceae bacterium]
MRISADIQAFLIVLEPVGNRVIAGASAHFPPLDFISGTVSYSRNR